MIYYMYRRKEKDMVDEYLITCGICGHKGYLEEDYFHIEPEEHDWAAIVCEHCGATAGFDPYRYLDVPAIIKYENHWGRG